MTRQLYSEDDSQWPVTPSAFVEAALARGFFTLFHVFESARQSDEGDSNLGGVKSILQKMGIHITRGALGEDPQPQWTEPDESEIMPPEEEEETPRAPERAQIQYEELEGPIAMYLREIDRGPLLTAEQEVALAKRIERERKAVEKLKGSAIDAVTRQRLESEVRDGRAAARALTEANLRLVVSIAKRYMGQGLPLLDLIQEGNLGLAHAVEKFDYRKGFRFSTYAHWWIRQAVTRGIANQARTIRVPVHMIDLIGDVLRTSRELQQRMGREPTDEEIARELQVSRERVQEILSASRQPISLETPVGEEEEESLSDLIADRVTESPTDFAARRLLRDHISDVLDELSDRERSVLRLRFGLDDGRAKTLEEIGETLGVSRERVRQIEGEALAKLRTPELREKLKEYLE
ncbi:MAG: sigma-70 family RNA polymerase sigma factor [Chloroflexota bacterium]|nr:MAG: sigma-70 family RNA polymerase sigma factor [Chloroflexota bacterium]